MSYLRASGGLRDQGGELRARDFHRVFPGLVNNKAGMSLDHARLMAAEAGYLGADAARAVAETTVNDLLDALDGHPVYAARDEEIAFLWLSRAASRKAPSARDPFEVPF